MGIAEAFGVKSVKLTLKGEYPTLADLYEKIKGVQFEAGEPSLVQYGFAYIIAFPQLDNNNQVQILGSKGKYTVTRSVQPAGIGNLAKNVLLEQATDGWSSMSGAFGKTKKRCMELVESTAKTINDLGI